MNKLFTITLVFLLPLFGLTKIAHAQSIPDMQCPPNSEFCFVGEDFNLGPADKYFGADFELAARFSADGSFSQVRFWGIFARFPVEDGPKDLMPSTVDFEIKIYESGPGGPGELISSYIFSKEPMGPVLGSLLKAEDDMDINDYLMAYDFTFPEPVELAEGYISITRISLRKRETEYYPAFLSLGSPRGSGESGFVKGYDFYKSDSEKAADSVILPGFESLFNKGGVWHAVTYGPAFALYNPPTIPLSNLAIGLGFLLMIAGSSFVVFRR